MSLSATAPRRTARTLFIRVCTVPGASPRLTMPLTQPSTCERRSDRSGTSAKGTELAASRIARTVRGPHLPFGPVGVELGEGDPARAGIDVGAACDVRGLLVEPALCVALESEGLGHLAARRVTELGPVAQTLAVLWSRHQPTGDRVLSAPPVLDA